MLQNMRPVPRLHVYIHTLTILTHFANILASTTQYLMLHLVLQFLLLRRMKQESER
jgi:hypothetical protein